MSQYDLELQQGKIGADGLAEQAGWIKTYLTHPVTREYLKAYMEYVMQGVSLSAGAYPDAPELPAEPGKAIRRSADGSHWETVPDHRGKTAWWTTTGKPMLITKMGGLPPHLTLLKPATAFDVWQADHWVTDEQAFREKQIRDAEQKKQQLLDEARQKTQLWQTQLLLNMISEQDKEVLKAWMNYIQALREVDTSAAPEISWPHKPSQ